MRYLLFLAALLLFGCAGSATPAASGSSGFYPSAEDVSGGGGYYAPDAAAAADISSTKPDLPPEKEKNPDFGSPESSPNFVFIPAADADRIVKISGATLKVTLIEVGDKPRVLKVVPGQDAVLAIDSGSDDVALLRSTDTSDDVQFLPVLPHCNALSMDPTGNFAVVWFDLARAGAQDPVGSLQAVSVIQLAKGKEASLTVSIGYRPQAVQFTPDGQKAMVVTADGVSVLTLPTLKDGDLVAAVPVSKNPLDKPLDREVLTTPDGMWAVVRQSEKAGVTFVNLPSHWITEITLDSVPTDLDLVPDGSAALVTLRDSSQVALFKLPATATTPTSQIASLGDLTAGLAHITDDGKTAVLYTSVAGIEQAATLDLATMTVQPVLLRKTVDYVFVPPGSRKAILVHKPAAVLGGTTDPAEVFVDNAEGYTLFDLDTGFTKLVLTPVKLTEIATSATPPKAWLLLPDPAGLSHAAEAVDLTSFLTQDFPLGSPPEHVRDLPKAGVVAVTQTHPSGRITFIGEKTGEAKTVTGYELNALVK